MLNFSLNRERVAAKALTPISVGQGWLEKAFPHLQNGVQLFCPPIFVEKITNTQEALLPEFRVRRSIFDFYDCLFGFSLASESAFETFPTCIEE